MRVRLWMWLLVSVLGALPVQAQETRGNINGVVQDKGGIIPGAVVRITNTDTSQTQQLVTNNRGYFEAPSCSIRARTRFTWSCRASRRTTRPASRWPSARP